MSQTWKYTLEDFNILQNYLKSVTFDTYQTCTDILERWACRSDPLKVKWDDICCDIQSPSGVVEDSSSSDVIDDMSMVPSLTTQSLSSNNGIPAVVLVPTHHVSINQNPKQSAIKISLSSKDIWLWAMASLFKGLEKSWSESSDAILERNASCRFEHEKMQGDNIMPPQILLYCRFRMQEITRGLKFICILLKPRISGHQRAGSNFVGILAKVIPCAICRENLHSALYQITMTLTDALVQLHSLLIVNEDEEKETILQHLYCMSSLESFCCVFSWLRQTHDVSETELLLGLHGLFSSECYKMVAPITNATESSSLEFLSRAFAQCDQIHRNLRNVYDTLGKQNSKSQKMVESILTSLLANCSENDSTVMTTSPLSLRQLVQEKLERLAHIPKNDYPSSLSSLPSSHNSNIHLQKSEGRGKSLKYTAATATTGKQPEKKKARKTRQRTVLHRSRNNVVNSFLSLDRENMSDEGVDNDAFVELEDFLVDG